MYNNAPQSGLASLVQAQGQGDDTMLVHMTPGEVQALQDIAVSAGGSLSLNPQTGLPQAGFLKELLPTIAGGFLKSVFPGMGELGIGLLTAGVSGLIEGDLKKGLMAGMGAYSGAKLTSGISQLGREDIARRKWEQEGIKMDRQKLATELGLTQMQQPQGGPRSNLIRGAMNLPVQPTVQMPDLEKLQEAYIKRELESAATQRPTSDIFRAGIGSLFKPKGFERFQTAVGGPEQAGFVVSPILGALQRAEQEKAQRKFARSQTPNYYYVPGQFDFGSGTFAPGGYYTAPGQPYTPKTGFAEGGVVFQEGGEATSTEPLQQYYQGLLTPPDTSMGEARRAETMDYLNWLNNFLKTPPVAPSVTTPAAPSPGAPAEREKEDLTGRGTGGVGGVGSGAGGGALIPGGGAATKPKDDVTEPPFDVVNVVRESPEIQPYVPPAQVPPQDIVTPPYPEIEPPDYNVIASDLADILDVTEPYIPETLTEDQYQDLQDSLVAPVINYPDINAPEPDTSEYNVIASDLADLLDVTEPYVPETLTQGQYQDFIDSLVAPVINYPEGMETEPPVAEREAEVSVKDFSELTPSEKRELSVSSELPPSELAQSMLERYQQQPIQLSDMQFTEPSREQVRDYLTQQGPPEINMPSENAVMDFLSNLDLGELGRDAVKLLAAQQLGPLAGPVVDRLLDTLMPEETTPAERRANYDEIVAREGRGGRSFVGGYADIPLSVAAPAMKEGLSGAALRNYLTQQGAPVINYGEEEPIKASTRTGGVKRSSKAKGGYIKGMRAGGITGAMGPGYNFGFAKGGLPALEYAAGGKLLNGPGDGMSDDIKANIDGEQEARLADGEFVVPADVVSHLGNGSTKAGAQKLYAMMDRVRKARTGSTKQGREINPNKFLPA